MRKLLIAAFLAGQVMTVSQPALAADFTEAEQPRMGAFGGLRVRVPLDGDARQRQVRAGLTVAPTMQGANMVGERPLRIGEGVELGIRGNLPLSLTVAGMEVGGDRLGAAQDDDDGDDDGVPTWAWVAGGVVVVLGLGAFAFTEAMNASSE